MKISIDVQVDLMGGVIKAFACSNGYGEIDINRITLHDTDGRDIGSILPKKDKLALIETAKKQIKDAFVFNYGWAK